MRARWDLPHSEDIRAQFPGRKLAIACVMDSHRKLSTAGDGLSRPARVKHPEDGLLGPSRGSGERFALRLQGRSGTLHTLKTNTYRKPRKPAANENRKIAENLRLTENAGMRVWNWELFKKLVRTKEAAGVPLSEQATALEVSHSTLQGYLDQRDRPPSKRMLELAPGYYRVKLDDLWVQSGLTDEAIEIQRARSMLLDCMNSDEASAMSDSEALSWYRFAKSTLLLAKNNTNKQG